MMKKFTTVYTFCSILAFVLLPVSKVQAQEQSYTLRQAVDTALQNHPTIEAAQARLKASEAGRSEERAGYFPQLNIGAEAGRIYGDNSTTRGLVVTRGAAYSGYGEGRVSLTQPLLGLWQTSHQVDAAQARMKSADQSLVDVRQKLALLTSGAYIEIARNREIIRHFQDRLKGMEDMVARIDSAVAEGGLEETDLQRAQNMVFLTRKVIATAEASLRSAEAEYRETVGMDPPLNIKVTRPALDIAPADVDQALAYAYQNNGAYLAAKLNANAMESDLEAEKLSLVPDLDSELSYLKSDQRDEIGGETIDARAVVRLNWDFSTGGAQFARIKKKRYEREEAMATAHDTKKQLERMIRSAYANYEGQLDILGYETKRKDLADKIYQNSEVQFDGARITLFQLLGAFDERSRAEYDLINARYNVMRAQYDILANLGLLTEALGLGEEQQQAQITASQQAVIQTDEQEQR